MTFDFARACALIPELAQSGVEAITFTGGGEPLMHPKAEQIFTLATGAGLQWGLVTNGYLLRGSVARTVAQHARFVRVSLDAGTSESHQIMHRPKQPQFEAILSNIGALVEDAKRHDRAIPLTVGASFCVADVNAHEIGRCAARLKALGANYLEVRPTYPTTWRGDGWDMALTNVQAAKDALEDARREFSDASFQIIGMIDRFDSLADPEKGYSTCRIGPLTSVLGADGRLWHCCVQRGQDEFCIGNVHDGPFAEVWADALAKRLDQTINVAKCPRCRYDNYNRLLEALPSDPLHAAFL